MIEQNREEAHKSFNEQISNLKIPCQCQELNKIAK